MKRLLAAIILALIPLAPIPVLAGTTGSLSGRVVDFSGVPVVGASISIASPTATATTTTDKHGFFVFVILPPDTYTLHLEKNGYNPVRLQVATFADLQPELHLRVTNFLNILTIHRSDPRQEPFIHAEAGSDVYDFNRNSPTPAIPR